MIDWPAEARFAVHGLVGDIMVADDLGQAWPAAIDRHLGPVFTVNPDLELLQAVLAEAVGVAVIAVRLAAVWTGKPPAEVLELVNGWRLPPTEAA